MSPFRAGLIGIIVIALFGWFGFTKANPFANPFELQARFENAGNLKPRSPVRVAGVEIGRVTGIESEEDGSAIVTMEIDEDGLPLHDDAQLKVRPRIFLEGNFFVDVFPGTPGAGEVESGDVIPMNQTAAPDQFGDLLNVLQNDVREDLKTFLDEYSEGITGAGARGFNESIRYWESAYRNSSLANEATLGEDPGEDLRRVLRGQQRTFSALVRDEEALKDLVTNFASTAGALAREDAALEASIPALRDTLAAAEPALASLNRSLPSLSAFSRDALPGVRSSEPTLREGVPFIEQARLLFQPSELRGAARVLRQQMPALVGLNRTTVPVLEQGRTLSACTNEVLVPFLQSEIPNVEGEPENSGQQVRYQIQRGFPGLAGEGRLFDANDEWFHTSGVPNPLQVQPAPPPDGGDQPPPRRPDVPCETQEAPNLAAPVATVAQLGGPPQQQTRFDTAALQRAADLMERLSGNRSVLRRTARAQADLIEQLRGGGRRGGER